MAVSNLAVGASFEPTITVKNTERVREAMSQDKTTIVCPNCKAEIDVNDILYHQVDDRLRAQYEDKARGDREALESREAELVKQQQALEAESRAQTQLLEKKVKEQLSLKEVALRKQARKDAEDEQSSALSTLREELDEKSKKLIDANKVSAELEKLRREKDELTEKLRADNERELNQRLATERQKISKEEAGKNELRLKEMQKQLEDQKKLTEEMKRKQEQGSMQTQGEVQELAIEEWLAEHFPLDTIQEIKKGERGADCLHIVNTRSRQNCGSVYYESKRTKHFQPTWIEKFKADIQDRGANIGVLVTEAMPVDMERMGLRDGVWICSFDEFKGLCTVLRQSIIQISSAVVTQENKGDKMGMLYDFLTSNEFQLQIEAIVEGFTQMKSDLESEQRSMRAIWKKREKQIEKVLLNTTGMYGSIKGIAGSAVQSIALLELADGEQQDLLE